MAGAVDYQPDGMRAGFRPFHPVFPAGGVSAGKPALGVEAFRKRADAAPCPVYALGGINADRGNELHKSGACGIAGIDAVQTAFRPVRT